MYEAEDHFKNKKARPMAYKASLPHISLERRHRRLDHAQQFRHSYPSHSIGKSTAFPIASSKTLFNLRFPT